MNRGVQLAEIAGIQRGAKSLVYRLADMELKTRNWRNCLQEVSGFLSAIRNPL